MKYFLDTEFIENGKTIDLISIGIVSEDDRSLYLQNADCNFHTASDWVWRNVFPSLAHFNMRGLKGCTGRSKPDSMSNALEAYCYETSCPWRKHYDIKTEVLSFMDVSKFGEPEVWGHYADYDWVAFCQLFGTMMDLPKGFPMYCRDVKQLCDSLGNPELPSLPTTNDHNALSDALEIKMRYEWLMKRIKPSPEIKTGEWPPNIIPCNPEGLGL